MWEAVVLSALGVCVWVGWAPLWARFGQRALRARRFVSPGSSGAQLPRVFRWILILLWVAVLTLALLTPRLAVVAFAALALAPGLFQIVRVVYEEKSRRQLEASAIGFFYALRAFSEVGLDFATTLFQLGQDSSSAFNQVLGRCLSGFERGKPLGGCIERLHRQAPSAQIAAVLTCLLMAYRRGLAVGPLLDALIPSLEADFTMRQRIAGVRGALFAQAAVGFMVPWVLLGTLVAVHPGSLQKTTPGDALRLGVCVLGLQGVGVVLLWRLSAFNQRADRALRQDLLLFLDGLAGMIHAGYDMRYAWPRALEELKLGARLRSLLAGESGASRLQTLMGEYPDVRHRVWFATLYEVVSRGVRVAPTIRAIAEALRQEGQVDWQAHQASLGLKASLVLALFFVLPALGLVFFPWMAEFSVAFD